MFNSFCYSEQSNPLENTFAYCENKFLVDLLRYFFNEIRLEFRLKRNNFRIDL